MKKTTLRVSETVSFPHFRVGVGAVIFGAKGNILSFQRADTTDSWQSVQGGVDRGEGILPALFREIHEEIGLPKKSLKLVAEYPDWLAYTFPTDRQNEKKGAGQVQRWFLLKLTGSESEIKLSGNGHKTEFRAWKWTTLERHAREVVGFKRGVYKTFAEYFRKYMR